MQAASGFRCCHLKDQWYSVAVGCLSTLQHVTFSACKLNYQTTGF